MWRKTSSILISFVVIAVSGGFCLADCPSADLTGDCFVDYEDFALMAAQWLTGDPCDPCIPDDMAYIPDGEFEMGDNVGDGASDELPVHTVTVDSFYMGRYEITNQQYCDYLNSAFGTGIYFSGGIVYGTGNNQPYCDTHSIDSDSQIEYNDVSGTFSVREKSGRDMSDDPMVQVSWYGAAAYCNWRSSEEGYESCYDLSTWDCNFANNVYRLPTEAEWEYAARAGLSGKRFPWADPNISHSRANYYADPVSYPYDESATSKYHPAWDDGIWPYTSPVGTFSANGYGLYDMAGNVWEWCNDSYDSNYYNTSPYDNPEGPASRTGRVLRGGGWSYSADHCRVTRRSGISPDRRYGQGGFRIVLDLE